MIIDKRFKQYKIRAMIKRLFYLTAAAAISAVAFTACSSEIVTLPMGVSLDKNSVTLSPGETITLIVEVLPGEAAAKILSWSSSNPGVAMVENGVVRAITEGEATITVSVDTKLGQKKKSCLVTVAYPVRSVTIDKNVGYLSVGESLTLTAEVMPDDAPDKSVTWSSSDPEVAAVVDGVVTAQKPGTAIITVTAKVGEKIASCRIKVFEEKYMGMTLQDSQNATILLSGNGKVAIDWGDGSASETRILFPAMIDSISHNYSEISSCVITIEGEGIEYLNCSNNRLTSLEVSKNTMLTDLNCSNNQLMNLDVSKNTALTTLYCSNNLLLNLDLNNNDKLTILYCINNQLTRLSINKNVALKNLNCAYNQLTDLDVSSNTELTGLECARNQLTDLDVSKNIALENLNCSNNQLTGMDVSRNTGLTDFNCDYNKLNSLNVCNTGITSFSITNSTILENLIVCNNDALRELNCPNNRIKNLIVNNNYELNRFDCSDNQIKNLDVSTNTMLTYIYCHSNQLTSLDLSNNKWLFLLDCSDNPLTILDVSNNTNLSYLHCSKNQLTVLDLSKNIVLTHLNCQWNQLTSLDMSNNTALVFLQCQSNQLSYDALIALFETLHNKSPNIVKPLCIYGNPGASGLSYALMDALNSRTRWLIFLLDMNSAMLNPWQLNQ